MSRDPTALRFSSPARGDITAAEVKVLKRAARKKTRKRMPVFRPTMAGSRGWSMIFVEGAPLAPQSKENVAKAVYKGIEFDASLFAQEQKRAFHIQACSQSINQTDHTSI